MMSPRDDELLDVPSIVPDSDGRKLHTASTRPAANKIPRSSNSTAPGSGMLRQLFNVAAITALAAACAMLYLENTRQKTLNEQLQKRLADVESQLGINKTAGGSTDSTTLGEKVTSIDDSLKTAHEEIRKLWGVTNDKNKKMLESHDGKLTEHDKTLSGQQNSITELKKSVAQTEKSIGDVSHLASDAGKKADEAAQAIADMRSSVGAMQQRLAQGDPAAREAVQQATMAQEQIERLQADLSTLQQRVGSHDDSLRSIDSFRRSASSDLAKLKGQGSGGATGY